MNRLKELLARLKNRWTIRILLIALVASTGVGGTYLGIQKFKPAAKAPTKKVVTGVAKDDGSQPSDALGGFQDGNVVQASGTSDNLAQPPSMPPAGGYSYGGSDGSSPYSGGTSPYGSSGGYGTAATSDNSAAPPTQPPAQPPANGYSATDIPAANSTELDSTPRPAPYQPPVAGYGATDPANAQSPYGPPAGGGEASPADVASQPGTTVPDNPYRASLGDEPATAIPAESTDSAASAVQPPADAAPLSSNPLPTNPYAAALTPDSANDPAAAYSQQFNRSQQPAIPTETAGPAATPGAMAPDTTGGIAPPPRSFAADSSADGSAAPGMQPLQPAPVGSGADSGIAPLAPRALGGPATVAGEGVGVPGDRQFEGPQAPSIVIQKSAPTEIQVGKPATFEIRVRNAGQVAADNVVVTDHVPRGTTLIEAKPEAGRSADGGLQWELGTLQPGAEITLQMDLMPQSEGEIGSVAHVTFAAQATARSVCTRPLLTVEHTAPPKIMIGQQMTMAITVSNPGTGAATGVVVEEDVPEGLAHVAGGELEYEIGMLRPGESKRLELILKADKAGIIQNTIVVRGEGNLTATHQVQIEVVAPQLQVGVDGPKKRFLQRQATYTVSVANPGTATARDVELVAYLPRGMKFVDTDSQGQYDPQQHAIFWSLEELPAAKTGSVKLVAVPVEPGEQKLRVEGRAELGLTTANEQVVQVDASAELVHTVQDLSDPIEVGTETVYEVRVKNVGTKTATNVQIAALAPAEMKMIAGEGPTRGTVDGPRVVFEPLARLNPQEEAVFKVQVQGLTPGDHILRVQIASQEWPNPVSREESTRVYDDR